MVWNVMVSLVTKTNKINTCMCLVLSLKSLKVRLRLNPWEWQGLQVKPLLHPYDCGTQMSPHAYPCFSARLLARGCTR